MLSCQGKTTERSLTAWKRSRSDLRERSICRSFAASFPSLLRIATLNLCHRPSFCQVWALQHPRLGVQHAKGYRRHLLELLVTACLIGFRSYRHHQTSRHLPIFTSQVLSQLSLSLTIEARSTAHSSHPKWSRAQRTNESPNERMSLQTIREFTQVHSSSSLTF